MLWRLFEERFEELLAAWRRHDGLRRSGAAVAPLAEARRRLDLARDRVSEIRRAMSPEPHEVGGAVLASYCATLEATVFLYGGSAPFRCVCGAAFPAGREPSEGREAGHC